MKKSSQEAIRDLEANLASTKSELLLNSETALQTLEARMKIKDDDIKKELFDNIIDLEQNSKAAIQNLEDDLTQTRNGFKNNSINFEGTLKAIIKTTSSKLSSTKIELEQKSMEDIQKLEAKMNMKSTDFKNEIQTNITALEKKAQKKPLKM